MSSTFSRTIGLALTATSATLLAGTFVMAGQAVAGINNIKVIGLENNKPCSVATGCSIEVETNGDGQLVAVEFTINGNLIGTALPGFNGIAAIEWHPTEDGWYTVGARHSGSATAIPYAVGSDIPSPLCSILNSGSGGSGSAGSGSAGSGSAGSGSAGSGSGTGSAGSGSGGTGSGC